ncbi:AfsR/SARP family transcriptional regulator [Streptomyces sp. KMM 9044]|uniref:AfsR/SARP family transcriptional regulator n=1 Tax=Streptomyces sp. KMM 9044 TaxID=2744474 RepID=UPI002151B432|nr:tetratricopeptide repeat protein [Streptomyces sp. KMM 9044]WAX79210.1 tetratricopeptide repeat protein [Streptomyces sp. KMM 9044]
MKISVRLSGPVEVRAAGRSSDLGSTKTRLALAVLAWDAGRTVGVDTLIRRIWGEDPPVKAREALHAHVSRIRRALRIMGTDAPEIVSRTNSYVLNIDPGCVDLRRYTSCVDRARSLTGADDEEALRLLDRADELWRGEPLAGIVAPWAGQLRAALGEKNLAAAKTRAEILARAGRFAEAAQVLLPLAGEHPVDEALVEQLALALHGSSRTAEATRLLQRTRQRVVRDIGIDAGRRLHRVQQGILAGAPAAALLEHTGTGGHVPPRPDGSPPAAPAASAPALAPTPDNLPRDVPWVGRRDELQRFTSALREGSGTPGAVVTVEAIDGMGGVGKTALAVHAAHALRDRFPDGRLFLNLGGHAVDRSALAPERALAELLRLIGMDAKELPQSLDELVALWRTRVRERRMMVILDDAAGAAQVRPLLPGASPTAVVVTSRHRLPGLPGVRPVSLDVLPRGDAVALFEQRLGERRDTRTSDIEEIVRICGRLPLAIEIAASRLLARPSWSTSDLLGQLTGGSGDGRLSEIRDGERSITHVFALSYRSLDSLQRLGFRRAGLHFGAEFGPYAVAALTGLTVDVAERILEELLTRHLVSEPSPHRFAMHDLLRVFTRSLSGTESDMDTEADSREAVRALVDHYVRVADRADRLAYPYRSRIGMDTIGVSVTQGPQISTPHAAEQWLITESANLLDALDWTRQYGSEHQLAQTVHVLAGFLDMEGYLSLAEPLLRRAVTHWKAVGDDPARARALLDLGVVHTHGGRSGEALEAAREALGVARALQDPELEGECVRQLAMPLWQTGQYGLAQSLLKRTLPFQLKIGNLLHVARSHNLLGITELHMGQNREAMESFRSALSGFAGVGDDRGRYRTLNNIGELQQRMGDPEAAERTYREAISVAAGMGSKGDHATLHMNLASVLTILGEERRSPALAEEALALYESALRVLRSIGDLRGEAIALSGTGAAHRAAGRPERALPAHVAALALARRVQAAREEADILYDLALAEQDLGDLARAVGHLEDSLSVGRGIGARAEEERASRALGQARRRLGARGA